MNLEKVYPLKRRFRRSFKYLKNCGIEKDQAHLYSPLTQNLDQRVVVFIFIRSNFQTIRAILEKEKKCLVFNCNWENLIYLGDKQKHLISTLKGKYDFRKGDRRVFLVRARKGQEIPQKLEDSPRWVDFSVEEQEKAILVRGSIRSGYKRPCINLKFVLHSVGSKQPLKAFQQGKFVT